jgi:hypothetical protein
MPRISRKRQFIFWYLQRLESTFGTEDMTYSIFLEQLAELVGWNELGDTGEAELSGEENLDAEISSLSSFSSVELADEDMDLDELPETDFELGLMELVWYAATHRYILDRLKWIPKRIHLYKAGLVNLPDDTFYRIFRMTPEGFLWVLSKIEGNLVFYNNANYQQAPVAKQLAVTMKRLTSETATASSIYQTAVLFGISEGTVNLYTKQVVCAWSDKSI